MKSFEVKDLNLYYGEIHALKAINMEIFQNEVVTFIGPSGCGKSSLLRAFNRMNDLIPISHHTGEILFENNDIYGKDMDVVQLRTKVGMVFQEPNPFPMSIFDNVAYGLRVQGIKDKKIIEAAVIESLKDAALYDEVFDRLSDSALMLSGGQQQRLCIARAIALKPKVILMDEPTSALDPISTALIEELITKLKKNYTIIIVTHSMQQAARVSDKTAFLVDGVLIEYQDTKTMFHTPLDKRTENYITGRFG